jgi:hypothetical protein
LRTRSAWCPSSCTAAGSLLLALDPQLWSEDSPKGIPQAGWGLPRGRQGEPELLCWLAESI